jgi:hypothetical protein
MSIWQTFPQNNNSLLVTASTVCGYWHSKGKYLQLLYLTRRVQFFQGYGSSSFFEKLACSCTDADSTNVVYLFGTPRVTTDDTNPTYT